MNNSEICSICGRDSHGDYRGIDEIDDFINPSYEHHICDKCDVKFEREVNRLSLQGEGGP